MAESTVTIDTIASMLALAAKKTLEKVPRKNQVFHHPYCRAQGLPETGPGQFCTIFRRL